MKISIISLVWTLAICWWCLDNYARRYSNVSWDPRRSFKAWSLHYLLPYSGVLNWSSWLIPVGIVLLLTHGALSVVASFAFLWIVFCSLFYIFEEYGLRLDLDCAYGSGRNKIAVVLCFILLAIWCICVGVVAVSRVSKVL